MHILRAKQKGSGEDGDDDHHDADMSGTTLPDGLFEDFGPRSPPPHTSTSEDDDDDDQDSDEDTELVDTEDENEDDIAGQQDFIQFQERDTGDSA